MLERRARDLIELDQLASGDPELAKQVEEEEASIATELRSRELDLLFTDPYANHNAVITISVGQGGVEAQDWVEMLMRMYMKWAERQRFEVEIIDTSPGEEAGLKSATFIVRGPAHMDFCDRSMASTGWCASRPSTRTTAGIRLLPWSRSCQSWRARTRAPW